MNKSELIRAIAERTNMTMKDSGEFLEAFIEITAETLAKEEEVAIVGFGSFFVIERRERTGRDFKTGKSVKIPSSKSIKFKLGKTLKEIIT